MKATSEQILFRQNMSDLLKNYTDKEISRLVGWEPAYIKKKRTGKLIIRDVEYYKVWLSPYNTKKHKERLK